MAEIAKKFLNKLFFHEKLIYMMYLKWKIGVRNKAKTLNNFANAVFQNSDFWPFLFISIL